ncbi:enoyl-CoA hydratase-related protein [Jatrophihabitans telluris]|uniref:Enoyl-CoA hydratase-related protein n=1 Tax=Jatrophihabitans telluris TaxID=2038343 RepID=A0ABY4R1H0_9ACTN|nr:enoyl-CoA hydratase-related protein [Jatrophihabitans telluris]UQX88980.1 enoyl-CoA hydratase-related protein [Jatrophihabitans telluris]
MSQLRVGMDGAVATVLVDRPPVNALSTALLGELLAAFEALDRDPTVRCVVLSALGDRCFVAGADIREAAETPPDRASERTALGSQLMRRIESVAVPVVAAINGLCLGGGCELAMSADLRIASTSARFGQPEIRLGIMPGFGGTQRLPRLIGVGPALDLMLTGRDVDAAEALRLGLVSRVVAPEELQQEAASIAAEIAGRSATAVRSIKAAVRRGLDLPLDAGLSVEFELSNAVRTSADAAEGLRAFLEKRPPLFGQAPVRDRD